MAPTSSPSTSAMPPPATNSNSVLPSASDHRSKLSKMTPTEPPSRGRPGGAGHPTPPGTVRGSVAVDFRLVDLGAGVTEVAVEDRLPDVAAVLEEVVDVRAQRVITLREADAVALLGEGLTDHLDLARVERRVTDQDRLVGRHRIHVTVDERLDTRGVEVELDGRHIRVVLADVLDGRRTGRRTHGRVGVEVGLARDRVVIGAHQDALARDEVRPGEVDLLLALVGDRVGA